MRITIEISSDIKDDDIVIKCREKNTILNNIENYIKSLDNINIPFIKNNQEYYFNLDNIIFFETDINKVSAHTINDVYIVKNKLYELEQILPSNFVRISKSSIVNIDHIYSISKTITSPSLIEFKNTHKKVYVSRFYFKNLKIKLKEKRNEKF